MKKKQQFSVLDYGIFGSPAWSEQRNKDWVYFGDNNLYPQYLDDLVFNSSIHNAIVKGTSDMIYAGGLDSDFKDNYVDQWLDVQNLFNNDTLYRVAWDLKLYGNAYINVIWNIDRTKIAELYHIQGASIRCGKSDDNDEVPMFYYSSNWAATQNAEFIPQAIPAFSLEDRTNASQILHVKLYNPISYYYGLPDYIGSTNYIELDKDISEFHLNNIKNGLFPSMLLNFNNGSPTDEERVMTENMIYSKFSGASNAGKILIAWNDSLDDAPTIEPIQNNSPHETYQYLSDQVEQKILSGHRVTSPLMFGIRSDGGGFGSNADEMRESFQLYNKTVIQNFQDTILNGIRPLLAVQNITIPLKFKEYLPAEWMNQPDDVKTKTVTFNQFSAQPDKIDDESSKRWLSKLQFKHAPLDWHLFMEEKVEDTRFDHRIGIKWNFSDSEASLEGYDNTSERSDWGDVISPRGYHFKLRYAYSENDSRSISETGQSREFCQSMVSLSKDGVMYRYEDIMDMSDDGVNGQFAEKGQSTYNIFDWIGGKNCYHHWNRRIFVQYQGDEPLESPYEVDVLRSEWDYVMKRVGNNPYVPQKGTEAVAPIIKQ